MNYKYKLYSKAGKRKCPGCGRSRTFSLYIHVETNVLAPEEFGMCDKVNSCGYHKYPTTDPDAFKERVVLPPPLPTSYTSMTVVNRSLKSRTNNLFKYICQRYGPIQATRAFDRYHVGDSISRPGCPVFWFIDIENRVRGGLIVKYNLSGKRSRTEQATWEHGKKYQFNLCVFGENLVPGSKQKIGIVEAPKTVLIASIVYPDKLWIATNGLTTLQESRLSFLEGRDVTLYPDTPPAQYPEQSKYLEDYWEKKAIIINKFAKSCTIFRGLYDNKEGTDLADIN